MKEMPIVCNRCIRDHANKSILKTSQLLHSLHWGTTIINDTVKESRGRIDPICANRTCHANGNQLVELSRSIFDRRNRCAIERSTRSDRCRYRIADQCFSARLYGGIAGFRHSRSTHEPNSHPRCWNSDLERRHNGKRLGEHAHAIIHHACDRWYRRGGIHHCWSRDVG